MPRRHFNLAELRDRCERRRETYEALAKKHAKGRREAFRAWAVAKAEVMRAEREVSERAAATAARSQPAAPAPTAQRDLFDGLMS